MPTRIQTVAAAVAIILNLSPTHASLPSRSRLVRDVRGSSRDNGRPIEGQAYRHSKLSALEETIIDRQLAEERKRSIRMRKNSGNNYGHDETSNRDMSGGKIGKVAFPAEGADVDRELGSQLTGCC